ncbi:uncharacterized protein LOC118645274 [Monomorium pharaonis]|uniref:uncharacterized protein LOC118645274 n=1 Tax=Monomorium pharaonis TaxID=307658 RepID=UPI00174775FC|nr:uncharacterized protein LOC118645274 [Monomorium pharaonis]
MMLMIGGLVLLVGVRRNCWCLDLSLRGYLALVGVRFFCYLVPIYLVTRVVICFSFFLCEGVAIRIHRCVKCEENHEPGKCSSPPQQINERSKLFCVNCRNYGHPASYKGCPKISEIRKRLVASQEVNRQYTKTNTIQAEPKQEYKLATHNLSYAKATKNLPRTIEIENTSLARTSTSDTHKRIYNQNFEPTIEIMMKEIINNHLNLKKIVEANTNKINTIASLLEKLIQTQESHG